MLVILVAAGLVAAVAAPWVTMTGTFQSWRLEEWHTFWRGDGSFLLADVVAPEYAVPVEFATAVLRSDHGRVVAVGAGAAAWHGVMLAGLLAAGARRRRAMGVAAWRVVLEIGAVLVVIAAVLGVLAVLLALPSVRAVKVDFRTPADVHTDTLVWSSIALLPVAPVAAIGAAILELLCLACIGRATRLSRSQATWSRPVHDRF